VKKYKNHFVKKEGEKEMSTEEAVKQLQEYVNVPLAGWSNPQPTPARRSMMLLSKINH
jgi:hypothetical protein